MQVRPILLTLLMASISLTGCAVKHPQYEAVARIGFRNERVDVRWELAFLNADRFLWEVFKRLPQTEIQKLAGDGLAARTEAEKSVVFQRFLSHASARKSLECNLIEVCFSDSNADFCALMANRIAEVYLSVKAQDACLVDTAYPPKIALVKN